MNFERNYLRRLYTIGEAVLWVGWFLAGAGIVGAISYYHTPLVPMRGLQGILYVSSFTLPYTAVGIVLVLVGGAFRDGRPLGRVGIVMVTILLEGPLLYAWYLVLIDAAGISSTVLITRGVLSLVGVVPLSFLLYVIVQWLRSPLVVAAFDEGHLADFDPEAE